MTQVHDRYSKTFAAMREEASVINWRALTELNVDGFVQNRPGVFMLAHQSPHDMNRVKAPPFHYGSAADLRAELFAMVEPSDPKLREHAVRGQRWFKLEYCDPAVHEQRLAALREMWQQYATDSHGHRHSPGSDTALEHRGDDAGAHK